MHSVASELATGAGSTEPTMAGGWQGHWLLVILPNGSIIQWKVPTSWLFASITYFLHCFHIAFMPCFITKHHKCVTVKPPNHQSSWCVTIVQRGRTTMVFLGSLSSRRTHLPPSRMENLNLPKWFRLFPIWAGQETLKCKKHGNRINVQMSFNFIESSIHY